MNATSQSKPQRRVLRAICASLVATGLVGVVSGAAGNGGAAGLAPGPVIADLTLDTAMPDGAPAIRAQVGPARWPGPAITYFDGTRQAMRQAVAEGAASWNRARVGITFRRVKLRKNARVIVSIGSMQVTYQNGHGFFATREMVEQALKNEGLQLQPLKCSRDKEGASNGNLVDAAKFPGKTSSGLWWSWQSAQQELSMSLTILYRRADMSEVECYSG